MNLDVTKPIYLLGSGGHCKVIVEILRLVGARIGGYCDFQAASWIDQLNIPRIDEYTILNLCNKRVQLCIAFLGHNVEDLKRRFLKMCEYQKRGAIFPTIVHPEAIISSSAMLMQGVQIFAGAIVNAFAVIKQGAVINTGSIVEHDAVVGSGAHLAPRSTTLGATYIGDNSYLGSGSVIIQGQILKEESFVKAGLIYTGKIV